MRRSHWIALGLALTLAAGAEAADRPAAARADGYDIHADYIVKSNYACGHWATLDGNGVSGLDWAVNGVVVAEDAGTGINWENDGTPYTVAIGSVSGGVFTAYHSEVITPTETSWIACFQV